MVVTKVRQIKSINKLSEGLKYIQNTSKTLATELIDSDLNFPINIQDGKLVSQLVSSHLIVDVESAFYEIMQTKRLANVRKGRPLNYDKTKENSILVHHIIQSFDPNDQLDALTVHEIGRQTALEFTNGEHQFVVATHMDKGHLHNHIYMNSTNSVTLNKFRWQKKSTSNLFNISNKYADLQGAKILERKNSFGHKEYSAYRKENVFKIEIKSRLEFLLKHSTSLEDFTLKANELNLAVNFNGKYVKYKLLDREQKRFTRDRVLSKKDRYSLESIEQRVSKNKIGIPIESIKAEYDMLQQEKESDFEMRVKIESWQVEYETNTGIYLKIQYGITNQGTVKIPSRLVDKQDDGSFDIYIKRSDFFYFMNPDDSTSNRFMKGSTLVNQLAYESGEYILRKNPNISKLDLLVKEYNYLVEHNITDSDQFLELRDRFIDQIKQTQESLDQLDDKIEHLNKIAAALQDLHVDDPIDVETARHILQEFSISEDTDPKEIEKQLVEVSVERKALKDSFDSVVNEFTKYEKLEKHAQERREQNKIQSKDIDDRER